MISILTLRRIAGLLLPLPICISAVANTFEYNVSSRADLEWGNVLFDYYQQDYFSALIEYEYAHAIDNPLAHSKSGRLLQGGMLLSYGIPDDSHDIFQSLLNENTDTPVRNAAWYYLANLLYHKSDITKAYEALQKISGEIPKELHTEYHYLATLIKNSGEHLPGTEKILSTLPKNNPHYAYVLFNYAISQLQVGNGEDAVINLERVAGLSNSSPELANLGDRARHGLSQLALKQGNLPAAWSHLQSIRTTGLYSNRGLLTYAWTAIKLKQFNDAIAALQILNDRSIAIPEVQEAKVLLAHLYEQEGSPRKALKSNLLAIEAFDEGLAAVTEARRIIGLQDVPKEFISNFDVIVGQSDWYAIEPTVDYQKLTPFVIDLTASHAFSETLKELSDLYTIQKNLQYWDLQSTEHRLILDNASRKRLYDDQQALIAQRDKLKTALQNQKSDLKLFSLTLEEDDQEKLTALIDSIESELTQLNSRVEQLKKIKRPYQQPASYKTMVAGNHRHIKNKLKETKKYIETLEPVMRNLVNSELDRHEERMQYYLAQSRLAKARLYDTTLMTLDKARSNKAPGEEQ
ncbi:tetratricopeptide repeat protein [Exilibacterium tricleocarpae]|uniref:Tetratricopeptide repeat protein n=1 Tax=Exilibacterium tricleocarpae TaxID=2591008 RepID=A0A545TAG5_9GAMM|nr:tetratricopeptide repeat protein [Exilibacterium tricleocarpae]TQV74209.1 tetratricopeptide repeat protein [Exilibacterium tricleocarpae]